MIFNLKENKIKSTSQCIGCAFFDTKLKKCNGFGKVCFEMDLKTNTLLDPKTKLPLSIDKVKEYKSKIQGEM